MIPKRNLLQDKEPMFSCGNTRVENRPAFFNLSDRYHLARLYKSAKEPAARRERYSSSVRSQPAVRSRTGSARDRATAGRTKGLAGPTAAIALSPRPLFFLPLPNYTQWSSS